MFKLLRWSFLIITTVLIICWLFVFFIASGINDATTYTQRNFISYYSLTDKDIRNTPRISDNYYFESNPGDGYAPSSTILFRKVSDVKPLRDYLSKLGYIKQKNSSGKAEIWTKPFREYGDLFYLQFDYSIGDVELIKELSD